MFDPDATPDPLNTMDMLLLSNIEKTAVLAYLVNDEDPAVAAAVVRATVKVLSRTRGTEGFKST